MQDDKDQTVYPPVDITVRWWLDRAPEVFSPMDSRGTADVLVRVVEILEALEEAEMEETEATVSESGEEDQGE